MIKSRIILSIVFLGVMIYQLSGVDIITSKIAIFLFVLVPIVIYYFVTQIYNQRIDEK